jgi:hypothetical protein
MSSVMCLVLPGAAAMVIWACSVQTVAGVVRRLGGMIRAVVFDVGECLVNETREYGTWAD